MFLNCGDAEKLLTVPWTARRSNQSILKELSPEYSLEGLMLKLKLQYFGHLMGHWFTGKDPDAGKDWRQKEKGTTEDEWLAGITDSMDMNLSQLQEMVKDREVWHAEVHGVPKSRTWLSNWTTTGVLLFVCEDGSKRDSASLLQKGLKIRLLIWSTDK